MPNQGSGLHIATFPHEGCIWDAYLEFHEEHHRPRRYLGRLRFDRAGTGEGTGSALVGRAPTARGIGSESKEWRP